MLTLTFLGHQGWLVSTASTHVLVDPLLTDGFGHGGLLGRVYPPRTLDLAGFPPLDAVVVTHEHDDHFDVPSLARLDRAVPIYLSSRSSIAADALLRGLGFEVRRFGPETTFVIGDVRYRSFVADHRDGGQGDEWDVFPMLIEDLGGHGSLLSTIDVSTPVLGLEQPPCVWAHAHNSTRTEFQRLRPAPSTSSDAAALLAAALRRFASHEACYGPPAAALIVGQGWSFAGEQAWINHEAFAVSPAQVRDALALASPQTQVFAPAPGFTLDLVDRRVAAIRPARRFLATAPAERWPDRGFAPNPTPPRDYRPACGRVELDAGALEQLLAELAEFARYLYGTAVFRGLCSLPEQIGGIPSAVGFAVRIDDSATRVILRYDPSGCRFVREPPELAPERALLAGIECYATDLLGFLRGELGPTAIGYAGRVRTWNAAPDRLRFSPHELWMFGHPLRRPDRAATLYARLAAELSG